MFDIGLPELVVILLIVLLVVGPEDVPRILYRLGRFVRYVSGHWNTVRGTIGDVMHEAELNEYRIKAFEEKDKAERELLSGFETEKVSDESLPVKKTAPIKKRSTKKKPSVKPKTTTKTTKKVTKDAAKKTQ